MVQEYSANIKFVEVMYGLVTCGPSDGVNKTPLISIFPVSLFPVPPFIDPLGFRFKMSDFRFLPLGWLYSVSN